MFRRVEVVGFRPCSFRWQRCRGEDDGPSQPVIDPTSLDELREVVLGDARGDVPSSVDSEVGTPGQANVEPDECRLLIPEFRVPELGRWNCEGMGHAELGDLYGRGRLRQSGLALMLNRDFLLISRHRLTRRWAAVMNCCARWQRFFCWCL